MSDYGTSTAAGGMSTGDGQTTRVGLSRGQLSPQDHAVLCDAICRCSRVGVATIDGKILRQACVSQRLKAKNLVTKGLTGAPTPYLPEITYDMRQSPPAPVMSSADPLQPHSWLPAWIQKYYPGGMDAYKQAKKTYFRRPDVVIVNDPSQPPVQSNIKQVVEMKFPPDDYSKGQREAYLDIAGDDRKLAAIGPEDCRCGDADRQSQPSTSAQKQTNLEDMFGDKLPSSGGIMPLMPPIPPVPLPLP
ncbi:VRR-NUC domain-containing protein [Burkholderia thailandensis]|uniref:VRR-NUC domain-containing protein n=1 Tax=Burkholderia thailandensis TaxID=57975 RepID=UPI0003EC69DB|nr:VRR-NUC domain-containing protein [Burkholderia thailandensis]AHI66319.1 VRR-NUC domain protein [Burkholderia thailandensis H0587]AOJ53881.1 VRR-NUC domain protein [Burkholderia thailandensis]AVR27979.1 VRR-NUC domain-containing protein [Burkholderia thailandensis]